MRCTMMTSQALLLLLLAYSTSGEDGSGSMPDSVTPSTYTSMFWCVNKYCTRGLDCLVVDNYKKCVDPCDHYSILDDSRRSVTNKLQQESSSLNDYKVKWEGWYRLMLDGVNAQMPETCVGESMCGASYPLWLSDRHPRPGEGVVRSDVCGVGKGSCCRYDSKEIHVKACPGGFYIYKLVSPRKSKSAYCAAVSDLPTTTTPEPTTTTTTTPEPTTTTPEPTTTTPEPTTTTPEPTTTTTTTPEPTTTTPEPTTTTPEPTTTTPEPTTTTPEPTTTTTTTPEPTTTTTTTTEPTTTTTTTPEPTTTTTPEPTTTTTPEPTTPEPTTTTTTTPEPTTTTTTTPEPTTTTTPEPTTTTTPEPTTTTTPEPTTTTTPEPTTTTTPEPTTTTTTTPEPTTTTTTTPELTTELVCGRSIMEIGLPRDQMAANDLDAVSAHLSDRLCSSHQERNGTVWYQVERKEGSCGNILKTNGSFSIFSNNIFVYPLSLGSGSLPQPIRIRFNCVYPMDTETSLDVAVEPYLGMVGSRMVNIGPKARASMSLFYNASYAEPYPAGRVTLPLGSVLYVGVAVEETEAERFAVVLENCYATHSANPEDPKRYFLIQHKCPTDRRQVVVTESGSSLKARFSALLFLFQGDYRDVFLHCSLSLCDRKSSSCTPMCSRRRARSVSSLPVKPLTIGPIALTQNQTPK